ncbi:PAS domain-containing protein [Kordiimonas pumila]|uniref:PAS domain-containing protein n=1 Tax=Kordiimonas pumila TaxID=2161677 RepID=A0ABV7D970_9PROT|nr:PAS domain-containing protein [Kordiimonas pumila]
MLSSEICQFLTYWQSLGGGSKVPARSMLDLRQLTQILPWMYILEMSPDGAIRYRLAGSAIEAAVGCGMAGKIYSDVFSERVHAKVIEELFAVSLVQGCGVLRTGKFSLDNSSLYNLETLTLPFSDARAMGGIILVGVMCPFEYDNDAFVDKWGALNESIEQVYIVPSPRIVTYSNLTKRVSDGLDAINVQLRIVNLKKILEINSLGTHRDYTDVPSHSVEYFAGKTEYIVN